ncbi:hypothetical protein FAUST_2955 [Fusarium austroamericanum]|uniref:Endo-arabinase n=1 Tax=Fusarium austroamericanum TaxID=282268 RepID=A0AAN6C5N2_FUSAU|nr:hypothetical protein FAUST_2955 [Fusarium austroamericanum]
MPIMSSLSSPWRQIIVCLLSLSLVDVAAALPSSPSIRPYLLPPPKQLIGKRSESSPSIRPYLLPPPKQLISKRSDNETNFMPRLDVNFPDPCLLQDQDGRWLSFATSGNGHHIQIAMADDPFGEWTHLEQDALPGDGWTSGRNFWAPDVRKLADNSYVMYFAGENPEGGHCIGVARSQNSTGPYEIDPEPFACPKDEGGAIDPAGFYDKTTNKRYVVYKVDGNALKGGAGTPIRLQEVSTEDGSTKIGEPVDIMNRIPAEDGPLVEAPNLVHTNDGKYLLFFSSHMYSNDAYDVKYAVAEQVEGPYVRGPAPFLKTPALGLKGPGGGTSAEDGGFLVFHAWCQERRRCMYAIGYDIARVDNSA